mmetsp:Transcript_32600/g.79094  ORF Transcript_32600/g.79094 Transcript_32600/m.79094 type:complete len:153 (+) Transcript_32600:132-590(+)|eukprot:CAMPEP_0113635774 /NCGR_PEP_ID=MMETSP0017_2-20120614/18652_1 /TAXON_ID=2856 /ORGANISM="Cylindrotheca closterium" /LENGTH=152 /DNA_ID=CAMNT_0000546577 /DNA_START=119 /DNA_END=577 /DNA_ORIENTATION=+ /assembly_acc=CAM_ASM_000147
MKFSLLTSLALCLCQTHAFTTLSAPSIRPRTFALAVTDVETDNYFRAIECAEGSSCSMEELETLAADLEDVEGCKFEEEAENCDREVQDRLDVAHMLRLRIELQLRMDYLKKENLFASDVQKSHDLDERRRFKEMLQANRDKVIDGADLGLW